MSVKMFILSEQIRCLENSIQVRSIRSDNLSAQTSTDMPLGGQELRRSGMEEGEASKAVNSSVISETVTSIMFIGNMRAWESTHRNIGEREKSPTVVSLH